MGFKFNHHQNYNTHTNAQNTFELSPTFAPNNSQLSS